MNPVVPNIILKFVSGVDPLQGNAESVAKPLRRAVSQEQHGSAQLLQ
jgi:hypothetical protein